MRKAVFTVILILLAATPALAEFQPMRFGGWGGVSLGVQYLDLSDLNDFLDPVGFDEVSSLRPTIGLSGHAMIFDRILLGGRGSVMRVTAEADDIDMAFTSGWGQVEAGYVMYQGTYGMVAPMIGLGGYGHSLHFEGDVWRMGYGDKPSETDNPRIAEGLDLEVLDSFDMHKGGVHGFLGLTYLFPVRFPQDTPGFGVFVPSLTVGGTVDLLNDNWRDDDGDHVKGGPDIPFNTFYCVLEIGFGGGTTNSGL